MLKNVGTADKIVRLIIAALLVILYFANVVTGIFGIICLVFAGVLILTSLVSFCPIYLFLKLKTTKKEDK